MGSMDWVDLDQDRDMWRLLVKEVTELTGSYKRADVLE
jgi:hypothetical protein